MPEKTASGARPGNRLLVAAALATIYLVWGSTYLGIRVAIETIPPFLMSGARFLVAGALLYPVVRWRGAARPTASQWAWATLVGALLLVGGNGMVAWAEQYVASGIAALLVATVPLWMVVLQALLPGGGAPRRQVWWGLAIGFLGVGLLVLPAGQSAGEGVHLIGAIALIAASLSWAIGSLISRGAKLPSSALLATAMQMMGGGALLVLTGSLTGEWSGFELAAVSWRSWAATAYLALVGSILAFSAYVWLLRATSPTLVATYAFVNPVVAVVLGWAVADEPLNARILVAAAIIVIGVFLITGLPRRRASRRRRHRTAEADQAPAEPCDQRAA